MLDQILALIAAGNYWPALAAGLMAATYFVRRGGADAWLRRLAQRIPGADDHLQLSHLRAWIPLGLAAAAWGVAVALPIEFEMREAAHALLLSTIAAMAGHDIFAAAGTLARVLRQRGKSRDGAQ
jgi:hypothetical protein